MSAVVGARVWVGGLIPSRTHKEVSTWKLMLISPSARKEDANNE